MQISSIKKYLLIWVKSLLVQLSALCSFYGIGVTLLLLLHIIVGEKFVAVSILNNAMHLITLFCIPAFLVTLLIKEYRFPWALYLVPGVLAFIGWYGTAFIPRILLPHTSEAIELTIMTYNIEDSSVASSFVIDNSLRADVVGLQELLPNSSNISDYIYQSRTNAVFTQFPLISQESIEVYRSNGYKTFTAVKVEVMIVDQIVSIYSLHTTRPSLDLRPFKYTTKPRHDDILGVAKAIASDPNPILVLCDCNFSDRTDDYKIMDSLLNDAWKQSGFGLGLTAPTPEDGFLFPLLRSDYIWHSDEFKTVSIEVLPIEFSDHYPVIAQVQFYPS